MRQSSCHRARLGEYIRAGRHLVSEHKAKSIPRIAAETGMSTTTARHWLKVDHYAEWLEWWPSVDALWLEAHKNKPPAVPMSFDDFPDCDPAAIAAADDIR
jgi:hypothetical protein